MTPGKPATITIRVGGHEISFVAETHGDLAFQLTGAWNMLDPDGHEFRHAASMAMMRQLGMDITAVEAAAVETPEYQAAVRKIV